MIDHLALFHPAASSSGGIRKCGGAGRVRADPTFREGDSPGVSGGNLGLPNLVHFKRKIWQL